MALGYLGSKPAEGVYVTWAQIFTVCYFLYFLVVMPIVGLIETPQKRPRSITEAVLGRDGAALPSGAAAAARSALRGEMR